MVLRKPAAQQVSPRVGTELFRPFSASHNVLETRDATRAAACFSGRKRQHPNPDAFADSFSPVVFLEDAH